jgi:hypothetical protein
MQPTLLVGPSDWDAARMPKAEFLARSTTLWRIARAASGAIVYGDRTHHPNSPISQFHAQAQAALALIRGG